MSTPWLVMEPGTSRVSTWRPEDGPATIRTASGTTYAVDGRRRIRGGSLALRQGLLCGAVDQPDGRIRVSYVAVGLRLVVATEAGCVYSSAVTEIAREADQEARSWASPA